MGALIMTKVPGLELSDVVSDGKSMSKITQSLLKYVIDSYANLRHYFDDQADVFHERCIELEQTYELKLTSVQTAMSILQDEVKNLPLT
jgi:phosphate uptake regulator